MKSEPGRIYPVHELWIFLLNIIFPSFLVRFAGHPVVPHKLVFLGQRPPVDRFAEGFRFLGASSVLSVCRRIRDVSIFPETSRSCLVSRNFVGKSNMSKKMLTRTPFPYVTFCPVTLGDLSSYPCTWLGSNTGRLRDRRPSFDEFNETMRRSVG